MTVTQASGGRASSMVAVFQHGSTVANTTASSSMVRCMGKACPPLKKGTDMTVRGNMGKSMVSGNEFYLVVRRMRATSQMALFTARESESGPTDANMSVSSRTG